MEKQLTIEEVDRPSPAFFRRQFLARNKPVLIHGVAKAWPAYEKWTLEYLKEKVRSIEVPIEVNKDGKAFASEMKAMSASSFIDIVEQTKKPSLEFYLAQVPILDKVPALAADIGGLDEFIKPPRHLTKLLKALVSVPPLLWLGPAGTISQLHFDENQNFLTQIRGKKKIVLFSPDQTKLLYQDEKFGLGNHSAVHFMETPDLQKFPLFAQARPIEITLEAGDILYIPPGWWHYVRSLEVSISLNFQWKDLSSIVRMRRYLYANRKILWQQVKETVLTQEAQAK